MTNEATATEATNENVPHESRFRSATGAIEYALGGGITRMFRSTWGDMLERSKNLAFGSNGKPHPKAKGPTMPVKRQQGEPAYEMRLSDSRVGWAFLLLGEVGRIDPKLRAVLEIYHGNEGSRWARPAEVDRGTAPAQLGHASDKEWSLFPLTKHGQRIVKAARAKHETSREIRDDELIALDIELQRGAPNDLRGMAHKVMRRDAEALRDEAWVALARAVEAHPPPRRTHWSDS
jgi:hypothetical protein